MAFASTRLLLIVTGYLVLTMFPAHPVESWQGIVFPDNNWIDGWVRWDSMWYEAIVNSQPRFLPAGHSTANFFPLYSFVSWIVALPIRLWLDHERAFYIGGLIVSSASFLLALVAVFRLASKLAGADVAVPHGVADRRVPVLVLPDRRVCRRVLFLSRRVVVGVRL